VALDCGPVRTGGTEILTWVAEVETQSPRKSLPHCANKKHADRKCLGNGSSPSGAREEEGREPFKKSAAQSDVCYKLGHQVRKRMEVLGRGGEKRGVNCPEPR